MIALLVAVLAAPIGTLTLSADCWRVGDLDLQDMISAGKYEGTGGERYEIWIGTDGRMLVTMVAPVVRNAVCVLVEAKELPEI